MDIAQTRADLAAALAAALDVPVYPAVPERLHPPLIYLREAENFITPDEDGPFGAWVINFAADLIIPVSASNEKMIGDADHYAAQLLDLANNWHIEIGAYATASVAGQTYLSVPIHIHATH